MATIKEITTMCRAGQVAEAYEVAKVDYEADSQNVWAQREMGWALYYMIKEDADNRNRQAFYDHLDELAQLEGLTTENDALIFDNVVWKLVEIIKLIPAERVDELDRIYAFLSRYTFAPSTAYSVLLKQMMKLDIWPRLVEFLEWWNIGNLMSEDYQPFQMENGRKIMSLAEQVYIAYSKALLKLNDQEKIQAFIPKIEQLMEDHPDMMYPGYFCGKLKLALGVDRESTLDIILPFVRRKQTEFWVWDLLCEVYQGEEDIQLACLLRAVHCRTQETFLGKVRLKLVAAYVQRGDYPRAKYHLDQTTRCYMQQGWHLSSELKNWMRESWINSTQADSSDGLDYRRYTNEILARGVNESVAVVTYVDTARRKATLVYAERRKCCVSFSTLGVRVKEGTLLQLQWVQGADGNIMVVGARIINREALPRVSYIQLLEGRISRHENNPFAFIRQGNRQCFIRPEIVQSQHLHNNDEASVLAVLDYNKRRESWDWTCVTLIRR